MPREYAPTAEDVDAALLAVRKAIIGDATAVPPYLGVELANIYRCLQFLAGALRKAPR